MLDATTRRNGRVWLGLAVALVATAIAYHAVASAGFVYDDLLLIERNPSVRSFANAGEWFAHSFWRAFYVAPEAEQIPFYRPVVTCVLALGHALGGESPLAYHLLVLSLHLGVTAGAFAIGLRFLSPLGATVAALAFGLIPVHVESVAWISGVSDVSASTFGVWSAVAFFVARDAWDAGSPRARRLALAALSSALMLIAFLAKESALAFPFAFAAIDAFARPRAERRGPSHLAPYFGWAAALAIYFAIRVRVFHSIRAGLDLHTTEFHLPDWRFATLPFELFSGYLGKLAEPFRLASFRPLRVDLEPTSAPIVLGLASTAAFAIFLAVLFLASRRRFALRVPLACLLFTSIAILPMVSNPRGMGYILFCERFLYIPSLGFAWLLGWLAESISTRSRPLSLTFFSLLLSAYAWRTLDRVPMWHSETSLFEQSKLDSPDSATVLRSLGRIYLEQFHATGDVSFVERASQEFKASIDDARCKRVFVASDDVIQGSLGIAWCNLIQDRPGLALGLAEQVIEKFPLTEEAYVLAGVAAASMGNVERAESELKRAISLRPTYALAHANLGHLYLQRGAFGQAALSLQEALRIEPSNRNTMLDLGRALMGLGRDEEGQALIRKAGADSGAR